MSQVEARNLNQLPCGQSVGSFINIKEELDENLKSVGIKVKEDQAEEES